MMNNLSPVRIVKNPDGSLAQAAMMQVTRRIIILAGMTHYSILLFEG